MNVKALLIITVGSLALTVDYAFSDTSEEEKAAIAQSVGELIDTMEMTPESENLRLGKMSNGAVRFLGAPPDAHAQTDVTKSGAVAKAIDFLQEYAMAFGVGSAEKSVGISDFCLTRDRAVEGRHYIRLQQYYRDVPVFSGEAIVQMDSVDKIAAVVSGLMTDTDNLDALGENAVIPTLGTAEAEEAAIDFAVESFELAAQDAGVTLTAEQIEYYRDSLEIAEGATLCIYDPSLLHSTGLPTLAYQVSIGGENNPDSAQLMLINAATGDLLLNYPLIYEAMDRRIRDQENNLLFWPFGLSIRDEGDASADEPERHQVNLAYDYLGYTYNFYSYFHGRDSIDNNGLPLKATVRFCPSFLVLIGKATCPFENAAWTSTIGLNRIFVGDGFVTDDIIGHEFTHGVTNIESGLKPFGQSGAISESLSDIWGEFIDQTNGYGNDSDLVKWLIGEDISIGETEGETEGEIEGEGSSLPPGVGRSMNNPPLFSQPARLNSIYFQPPPYSSNSEDNGGVHINNGVNNFLCYLLTDGDTFMGRTIYGMGMNPVLSLYYECQCNLLTSNTDYYALYYALSQAAINLNFSVSQRNNIDEACRAVEIRPTTCINFLDSSGDPVIQLTNAGDLIMCRGTIHENATITPNPALSQYVLNDINGNPLALVDGDTGDLYIIGQVYEQENTAIYVYSPSLVVLGPDTYPNQPAEPVIVLTSEGYLCSLFGCFRDPGSLVLAGTVIYPDDNV
ncbi:MAG TPA: M4 family metallopeptidase [Candidatus Hydrogenedentes bacterium]|nr:M4 family metallopeptidase [Candidatus Hydrogenedentota bacterium]